MILRAIIWLTCGTNMACMELEWWWHLKEEGWGQRRRLSEVGSEPIMIGERWKWRQFFLFKIGNRWDE